MPHLLLVEDNESLLATLFEWFESRSYTLDCARTGLQAENLILHNPYDCVILDVMLPGLDGISVCKNIRAAGISVPLIMLTARDSVEDTVEGLEAGADDYLIKPFSLKELTARVEALLRRPGHMCSHLSFGPLQVDLAAHSAMRGKIPLKLTPTAFKILTILIKAAPGLVTREYLERALWGEDVPGSGALRNHILELRRVVDKPFDRPVVETVPHTGYRLKDDRS